MRKCLLGLLAIMWFEVDAQNFEGTVKWEIDVHFADSLRQQRAEQTKKAQSDRGKKMIEPSLPDSISQDLSREDRSRKKEIAGGGVPTALMVSTKNNNALATFEGGPKLSFLYVRDSSATYGIDHSRKTYHSLPQQERIPPNASWAAAVFVKTDERARILDYNCIKYVKKFMHRKQEVTQELWTTNEIQGLDLKILNKVRINGHLIPFGEIDGVPMKFIVTNKEGTFSMICTDVTRKEVEDSLLSVPRGYKNSATSSGPQPR